MISFQVFIKKVKQGNFAPVYLFYGEEKYLQEELTHQLAVAFLGQECEFGQEKITGGSLDLEELLARLGESGLFARRRLLIADNPPYLVPPVKTDEKNQSEEERSEESREKSDSELLENYLKQSASGVPDSILVFHAARVDRRRRLFKIIDKKGVVIECNPLKGEALAAWIRNRVSKLGKDIERPAVEKLLAAGDQNLHYLSNELEKYCTFLGEEEKNITVQTVEALFSGDIQGDVFKLSDAMAEGNITRAYDILDLLLRRREKPLLIFFMLVRHYRLLLQTCCLMEDGLPQSEFVSALEVHPFVARKLREQAVLYNRFVLEDILLALQRTDQQIKTGRIEPSEALKLILSRIDYIQSAANIGV